MKPFISISLSILMLMTMGSFSSLSAASNQELEARIEKLEQQDKSVAAGLFENITLSGAIEVDYSYADDSDVADRTVNDSTSTLEVGTAQIGIEANLHEMVTAVAVLKGESLDASNSDVFWDEVYFSLQKEGIPVYLVAGKRTQPFGVFNGAFINDPITQELYEINDTGVTLGFTAGSAPRVDLSFTIYKGETLIEKVAAAGYGWARSNTAGYTATNDVNSYIVNSTITPFEGLVVSIFLDSEPGDSDRNNTLGGALHFETGPFFFDAEYIGALQREKHLTDNQEYKETAWTVCAGFQIMEPLLIAARYENFDADRSADGNLDFRCAVAGTYTLLSNDYLTCSLMAEYRRSEYETTASGSADDELDEIFARIAVEF